MKAIDILLHCIAAIMVACSLYCFYVSRGRSEIETGFTPCYISERTARIIGEYAFGESSISVDAQSLRVKDLRDQYHISLDDGSAKDVLVVSKMGGNFHWEQKSRIDGVHTSLLK